MTSGRDVHPHDGAPRTGQETNVRLFLAALMICAGVGFAWHHHQTSIAATKDEAPPKPRLFNWQSADETLAAVSDDPVESQDDPPLVVRDAINTARHEVTSVLDEFVRTTAEAKVPMPSQPDIVSQESPAASTLESTSDAELIPFASSDNVSSEDVVGEDLGATPADATAVSNQTSPSAASHNSPPVNPKPEVTASSQPKPSYSEPARPTGHESPKPTINEATLVTREPVQKTVPTQPVAQPERIRTATPPASRSKPESTQSGKPPAKSTVDDSNWKVIGKTNNQLPMHSRRFGRQGVRTLVIAGLDGRDQIAIRWNDQLVESLVQQSELFESNEVMVVRAGNPDGLMKKTAANSNGVLINRNFPSRRYQYLTDKSAGPGPASEVETHAILDVLYSFRPRRVIHLASTTGRSTVMYNRAARTIAMDLQKEYQWEAQPLDVELITGSVEDFADGTLEASVISVKLNTGAGAEWRQAWSRHQPAMLAALDGHRQDKLFPVSDELSQASPDQAGTRIPTVEEEPAPVTKRRRGYEELPPPPR